MSAVIWELSKAFLLNRAEIKNLRVHPLTTSSQLSTQYSLPDFLFTYTIQDFPELVQATLQIRRESTKPVSVLPSASSHVRQEKLAVKFQLA